MTQTKHVSTGQGTPAGFLRRHVNPNLVGVLVVIVVMAIPGVPVGYLTPGAVFLGALGVYGTGLVQRRRGRTERSRQFGKPD